MAKFSILQQFYNSKEWISFRLGLIAERGNKCQHCGKIITRSIDIIGHHKTELTPENVHDVMISLNPENVLLVDYDCHNEIHKRFGYGGKVERKVYLVYGPPMAGKKTFVKQQMKRGDIVIDIDRLYEAVSMMPSYDKPDNLLNNVIGVQSLLIDNIKTRLGKWNNAWIIGGYADKYKREKIATDVGAELVFINTPKEECMLRVEQDEQLQYRISDYTKYIDKWFDSFRE
jgi:predicted kinase